MLAGNDLLGVAMRVNYRQIEETALANFELLLAYWKIDYIKISEVEYDFKNPNRKDTNFGACRFNTEKGKGADFAGISFSPNEFSAFGPGFTRKDFASPSQDAADNWGFNVIGLCQRISNATDYQHAAKRLNAILREVAGNQSFRQVTEEFIRQRDEDRTRATMAKRLNAAKVWGFCSPYIGTAGEEYFKNRNIFLNSVEPNIRFHPRIKNAEIGGFLPALLFKVQADYDGDLVAIHRIYIKSDGSGKADLDNNKMALGSIKGAGIWFGEPDETLYVAEGPESALSLVSLGYKYVISSINAGNFAELGIPDSVRKCVLCPDNDGAGMAALAKANVAYGEIQKKKIEIKIPPSEYKDWNDMLTDNRRKG